MTGGANLITCADCGETYPLDPREEGPEDHADDCPVALRFIETGRWER